LLAELPLIGRFLEELSCYSPKGSSSIEGDCIPFRKGKNLLVEEFFSWLVHLFKQKGQIECYWDPYIGVGRVPKYSFVLLSSEG